MPVQDLSERHMIQRLHYCQEILTHIAEDPEFLTKIIFTDEATFTTAGMFNRKNKHYWASENPHKIQPVKIQGRRSVHVWCGLLKNQVIGPIIFDGYLTGNRYLDFIQNIIENYLEELPVRQYNNLVWQQDGAPPHNIGQVTEYLNGRYDLWIGRNGTLQWPANSPDLSPLDIFLWGFLKNRIYYDRPPNIRVLRQRIEHEIFTLNTDHPDFISNAIHHKMRENIQKCVRSRGGYIENI